ncbi:hypothetical protein B0H17DRAFT_1337122 [Mycena rosella]|uniref:Uncharacterized protein n=1 Tax=Mycena rosella TaxID=1033263 RepID=A0AAD7CSP2_MYCRO|nr:hypothetical protein B0H17DRAFT_1337122 [Mycena rosella]
MPQLIAPRPRSPHRCWPNRCISRSCRAALVPSATLVSVASCHSRSYVPVPLPGLPWYAGLNNALRPRPSPSASAYVRCVIGLAFPSMWDAGGVRKCKLGSAQGAPVVRRARGGARSLVFAGRIRFDAGA